MDNGFKSQRNINRLDYSALHRTGKKTITMAENNTEPGNETEADRQEAGHYDLQMKEEEVVNVSPGGSDVNADLEDDDMIEQEIQELQKQIEAQKCQQNLCRERQRL